MTFLSGIIKIKWASQMNIDFFLLFTLVNQFSNKNIKVGDNSIFKL